MNARPILLSPAGSSVSANVFRSPSYSAMWVCMPEPHAPWIGFGMNVA